MSQGAGRPVAWGDESLNAAKTLYVLTAAVYPNMRAADHTARQLEEAARAFGYDQIHANRANPDHLDAFEQIIGADEALMHITTVQAPVTEAGGVERARQRCLAELAVQLTKHGVRSLTLDTRQNLRGSAEPDQIWKDAEDRGTIAAMKAPDGRAMLDQNFKIRHADDQIDHRLWIPDIVAYASYQALDQDDPDRLKNLAERMTIHAAEHLPVAQRIEPSRDVQASPELRLALDRMHAAARLSAGLEAKTKAYEKGQLQMNDDPEQDLEEVESDLQAALDAMNAARHDLERADRRISDYEHGHKPVRSVHEMLSDVPERDGPSIG